MNTPQTSCTSCLFLFGFFILSILGANKAIEVFLRGGKDSWLVIGLVCVGASMLITFERKARAEFYKHQESNKKDSENN